MTPTPAPLKKAWGGGGGGGVPWGARIVVGVSPRPPGRFALRGTRQWSGAVTAFVKRLPTGCALGFMPRWSLAVGERVGWIRGGDVTCGAGVVCNGGVGAGSSGSGWREYAGMELRMDNPPTR